MKAVSLSTVRAKLTTLVACFALTTVLFAMYAFTSLNQVKIGGPIYERITQTMNLRSDILPPPQYLIETELTAFQMAFEAEQRAPEEVLKMYEAKLRELQKEFEEGQKGWADQLPVDTERARAIRVQMVEKDGESGRAYYKLLFGEFVPAIQAHDMATANKLLNGPMKRMADEHREIINQLVALTDISSKEDEVYATNTVRNRMTKAMAFIGVMLAAAIFFSWQTMNSVLRPIRETVRTIRLLEQGQLTARAKVYADDELGQVCVSLNHALESMHETIRRTVQSSVDLGRHSHTLSSVASTVATGVQKQAGHLAQSSAQLGEVTSISQAVAAGGKAGQQAANESSCAAEDGARIVELAIQGMGVIGKAAEEITEILEAVDEISFNTNLLAVNAAIEAAVSGSHGGGFKAVAEEIRSLSVRTANAGKKIRKAIADANEAIAAGTERVAASGTAFENINASVRKMKAFMDEIAGSSTTQADALRELNDTVAQIAAVVEQNSIGTETIDKTSQELAVEAQNMSRLVGAFSVG